MAKKRKTMPVGKTGGVYERIREILESARASVARSVNTTHVVVNWFVGRQIVEEEQKGKRRADYGERLLRELSQRLTEDFGRGWSIRNLEYCRNFYLIYPSLIGDEKSQALPAISAIRGGGAGAQKSNAPRSKSSEKGSEHRLKDIPQAPLAKSSENAAHAPPLMEIAHAVRAESWQPGQLNPNLSWTHYVTLMMVESAEARAFYEIETTQSNWSTRELERQIHSLLYERLALSKDKKGLMRLAKKGQEIAQAEDVFKDPVVIEFLGLPESPRLQESDLETALTDNLQSFLLELGKGFAFVARQERLTLDGDHFYIDLVFYHTILKCFVLIDLKIGKLTHGDLGQLQLYVNYYDQERCTAGDNPTLGLILCTDKNDAVVRYTLGPEQSKKIFASRYKLHLPSEAELQKEIRREVRQLTAPKPAGKPRRKMKKT